MDKNVKLLNEGKWVEMSDNYGHSSYFCSKCGTQEGEKKDFCPNCGSDTQEGGRECTMI